MHQVIERGSGNFESFFDLVIDVNTLSMYKGHLFVVIVLLRLNI